MGRECLTNQEVANKIDSVASIETVNEYSTVKSCTEMGADQEKLVGYSTIYECPAEEDITKATKITYRCTPGNNKSPFQFLDDGNWRENLGLNPPAWLCDMDRTDLFNEDNSIIDNPEVGLLEISDLLIIKFHPSAVTSSSISLLGIQDIDDGTIGRLGYDYGSVIADEVVWNTAKNGYTNNEICYVNENTGPEWVAIWRTSIGVYFQYWVEDDNITNVDNLVDSIISSPVGYLWVKQTNTYGSSINSGYVNVGQPYFNSGMYDPSQFYDVYWADGKETTQINVAIEGFYSCKGVIK